MSAALHSWTVHRFLYRRITDRLVAPVAGDTWPQVLDNSRFNAGVLSLEPAMQDFVELVATYQNSSKYQYDGFAEQARIL